MITLSQPRAASPTLDLVAIVAEKASFVVPTSDRPPEHPETPKREETRRLPPRTAPAPTPRASHRPRPAGAPAPRARSPSAPARRPGGRGRRGPESVAVQSRGRWPAPEPGRET